VLPETAQRVTKLRVHVRLVAEVAERHLVRLDGVRVAAARLVHLGDRDVPARPARLELEPLLEGKGRVLVLFELRAGKAEELVRLGDVALETDRLAERARRLLPARDAREG